MSLVYTSAYAEKMFEGKKLYHRPLGKGFSLTAGSNNLKITVPHAHVKFTGIEFINCEALDYASLQILDSVNGDYGAGPSDPIPNSDFGTIVNLPNDYYRAESKFDADLYINMQVEIVYESKSCKDIGINLIWDEVIL